MRKRNAFSLIEMLVVMAIITMICTLFFPVIMRGIDKGKQSQCINNLKQIGQAIVMYTQDWQGNLPQAKRFIKSVESDSIVSSLSNYIDNSKVYICPSVDKRFRDWYGISYVYNTKGYQSDSLKQIGSPIRHICDSNATEIWVLVDARPPEGSNPHFDFANSLWLDGHVEWTKAD